LGLLAAFQFLTLLPVKRNFSGEQVGRSTVFFPIVGIILGLILAGLNYLLLWLLPAALVNALLVTGLAVLSGGLHLDGLADTMDGMAGHRTPEQRLEIMRDSRIGGFGAIGLGLFFILEYVSLNSIPAHWLPLALILAPTLSRWAMVASIFVYPYARPSGLGKVFKEAVTWKHFVIATVATLAFSLIIFKGAGLALLAGAGVITVLIASHLSHQLKGLTGDTYGAINEAVTVGVFILISMLANKGWLL
jgi:adenosylcobinamide-GDP ribazoletransferase